MKDEQYYTLTGYKRKNKYTITETMEDYIEMIYRNTKEKEEITIKDLSILLNVRPSSVSKMINKLNKLNIVNFKKYGQISLTEKGKKLGYFYLDRHNTLTTFFKMLNKNPLLYLTRGGVIANGTPMIANASVVNGKANLSNRLILYSR